MNKRVPGRINDFCLFLFTVSALNLLVKQREDLNLDQGVLCTCLNNIVDQRSLRTAAKEVTSFKYFCACYHVIFFIMINPAK